MYHRMRIAHHTPLPLRTFRLGEVPEPTATADIEEISFNPYEFERFYISVQDQLYKMTSDGWNPKTLIVGEADYRNLLVYHQSPNVPKFMGLNVVLVPFIHQPHVLLDAQEQMSKAFWEKQQMKGV